MKTSSKSRNDPNSAIPAVTVGIDLGDSKHAICAIDAGGAVLEERSITNHREPSRRRDRQFEELGRRPEQAQPASQSLRRLSAKYPGAHMVMEVGSHSPWTSRFLEGLGHEVLVASARRLRPIYARIRNHKARSSTFV